MEEVKILAQSRAAYYGDGCFELLRSYQGRFVALDRHIDRLKAGMEYLGIKIPSAFTEHYFAHIIEKLLDRSELNDIDARIRIQVWRNGKPGYVTEKMSRGSFLITVAPIVQRIRSLKLAIVEQNMIPNELLNTSFKLSNGIHYILAERQAAEAGADSALMLTTKSYISQEVNSNIFWLKGNVIFTPSVECDILPGISRQILIDVLTEENNYDLVTGKFTIDDLDDAESVWLTNSVNEILPVSVINENTYCIDNDDFIKIRKLFKDRIRYLWL
ncbi:MAG TPA: aminotransferase class IV [Balneolales bacterium]|nr:aminotransferase class IV [Balneolales bacterium]